MLSVLIVLIMLLVLTCAQGGGCRGGLLSGVRSDRNAESRNKTGEENNLTKPSLQCIIRCSIDKGRL